MPRHPDVTPSLAAVRQSVFTSLAARLAAFDGPIYPLHIGDTWMEPAPGCRMQDVDVGDHPGVHRYSKVQGTDGLVDAIVERTRSVQDCPTDPDAVLVSAGATGGLGAIVGAITSPGDEVLILAPYWPLFAGIVRSFHATPVPVPFIGVVDSPESAVEAVRAKLTDRTVALYVSTPNNPSGQVIPESWLAALAELARAHDLWLLSDEVYEYYVYQGAHSYTRPMAPERTFSVHSSSKAFGMAGNRCGWVVGPPDAMAHVRKVSTHTFYSTPTAAQVVAERALRGAADEWVAQAREKYAALGRDAAETLGVPAPQGSTFLFVDVAHALDDRGLDGFLSDCVDRGLLLAPGPAFGPYPTHVRVCFTSTQPDRVRTGIDILAGLMGR